MAANTVAAIADTITVADALNNMAGAILIVGLAAIFVWWTKQ